MAEITGASSGPNLPVTAQPYCRRLRWKEMFVDADASFHPSLSGSGIYWCNHTQNCLGPDGEVAEAETCRPGRSCFEEF
jgi:hypothetical protein